MTYQQGGAARGRYGGEVRGGSLVQNNASKQCCFQHYESNITKLVPCMQGNFEHLVHACVHACVHAGVHRQRSFSLQTQQCACKESLSRVCMCACMPLTTNSAVRMQREFEQRVHVCMCACLSLQIQQCACKESLSCVCMCACMPLTADSAVRMQREFELRVHVCMHASHCRFSSAHAKRV